MLVFFVDLFSALNFYWVSINMVFCFFFVIVKVLCLDYVLHSNFFLLVWSFYIFNS